MNWCPPTTPKYLLSKQEGVSSTQAVWGNKWIPCLSRGGLGGAVLKV